MSPIVKTHYPSSCLNIKHLQSNFPYFQSATHPSSTPQVATLTSARTTLADSIQSSQAGSSVKCESSPTLQASRPHLQGAADGLVIPELIKRCPTARCADLRLARALGNPHKSRYYFILSPRKLQDSSVIFVTLNTLRTGLLNCLNARSRGLTFRHRASCI